jgi:hypothetical protein
VITAVFERNVTPDKSTAPPRFKMAEPARLRASATVKLISLKAVFVLIWNALTALPPLMVI